MAHLHPVYDDDPHFSINSSSREITYESNEKLIIIQGDHNSERYTFEIPKTVDGHDMTLCDLVQVHYINIDSGNSRERNTGLYKVDDVQVSPDDENTLVFSWLISQNATKLVGSLNFVVRFACTSGSKIDYSWSTSVFSSVTIATSIDNAGLIVEQYADVLESWYMELLSAGTMGVNIVTDTANKALADIKASEQNAANSATAAEASKVSAKNYADAAAASAEAAANFDLPITEQNGKLTVTDSATNVVATIDTSNVAGSTTCGDTWFKGKVTAGDKAPIKDSNDLARMKDVVPKATSEPLNGANTLYARFACTEAKPDGFDGVIKFSTGVTPGQIVQRTLDTGDIRVPRTPGEDNAATSKAYVDSKLGSGTYAESAGKIVGSDGTANYTVLSTRYYQFTSGGTNYKYLYVEPNNSHWGQNIIIGSPSNMLNCVYAKTFNGKLIGSADYATQASSLRGAYDGRTVYVLDVECSSDSVAAVRPSNLFNAANYVDLGTSSKPFRAVHATTFNGSLVGNASAATKATRADTATTATTATKSDSIKIDDKYYTMAISGTTLILTVAT